MRKALVMDSKAWALAASALLIGSLANADISAGCGGTLAASLHECERLVGSLRADKAGQMLVFAPDGSEFTAEQATWMKSQLRLIAQACTDGKGEIAARQLAEVRQLLKEHRHFSQG
jgi:hypothetical protein